MPSFLQLSAQVSHAATLHTLHLDDHPQQHVPQIPDPIGPVTGGRLEAIALNPQPLPPLAIGSALRAQLASLAALNPQPLPPVDDRHRRDAVALNPQPLPPHEIGAAIRAQLGSLVALNPQPLPPVDGRHLGDAVALNPQPLPPHEMLRVRIDDFCGTRPRVPPVPPPNPLDPIAASIGKAALR